MRQFGVAESKHTLTQGCSSTEVPSGSVPCPLSIDVANQGRRRYGVVCGMVVVRCQATADPAIAFAVSGAGCAAWTTRQLCMCCSSVQGWLQPAHGGGEACAALFRPALSCCIGSSIHCIRTRQRKMRAMRSALSVLVVTRPKSAIRRGQKNELWRICAMVPSLYPSRECAPYPFAGVLP